MAKDNYVDLTNFWLAWRETCAIRLCMNPSALRRTCASVPEVASDPEGVADRARDVMLTTNRALASLVRMPRSVKSLRRFQDADDPEASREFDEELASSDDGDGGRERAEARRAVENNGHFAQDGRASAFPSMAENDDDAVARARVHGEKGVLSNSRAKLVSDYSDYVRGWFEGDLRGVSAFELIEQHLYAKSTGEAKSGEGAAEPMMNGRRLKDYLFEDIGGRPGGLNRNLWGYLLKKETIWVMGRPYPSRLRQVANESFRMPLVSAREDDEGAADEEASDPTPDAENQMVARAVEILKTYLTSSAKASQSRWADEYDVNDRIAVCCAFFRHALTDPFVKGLATVRKLDPRKDARVSEIFMALKNAGCDAETVRCLFRWQGQAALREIALTCPVEGGAPDPACRKLFEHFGGLAD